MLLASLGTSIANIALPNLATAFAAPFAAVQAVVVVYLTTLTMAVLMAGRVGDRFGLRAMLRLGLTLFAAATALCAVAPTLEFLVVARGLQGVGAAFLMTLAMALMRQTAGTARIGRAMGLLGTVSAVGTALGPTLGGLVIPLAGWRGIFWAQLPLAGLALVLAFIALPHAPTRPDPTAQRLRSALDWALLPNLTLNFLVAAVMMTTLVVGPFYLGLSLGLPAEQVGLVMAIGPGISIAAGVPAGRLVDARGATAVLWSGQSLILAGALLLAVLPGFMGMWGYALAIAVLTPGYQLFQAANNTATLADVAGPMRGTVSGLLGLSRNLGLVAGAAAMGAIFAQATGAADLAQAGPEAIARGMQLTFLIAAALMLGGLAMLAWRAQSPR
ncbi:MFS transporter [Devosia aquimaris]|uniref:MFS transporter n=1 Tax=Devosia aquimaris TaxID=2866214 RepID=UPI0021E4BDA0|nr:MFS transporter [Devosia sp. CJK-A8-3]